MYVYICIEQESKGRRLRTREEAMARATGRRESRGVRGEGCVCVWVHVGGEVLGRGNRAEEWREEMTKRRERGREREGEKERERDVSRVLELRAKRERE